MKSDLTVSERVLELLDQHPDLGTREIEAALLPEFKVRSRLWLRNYIGNLRSRHRVRERRRRGNVQDFMLVS